jgi:hypothetical protein
MAENSGTIPLCKLGRDSYSPPPRNLIGLYKRLSVVLFVIISLITVYGFFSFGSSGLSPRIIWFVTGASGLFVIWLIKRLLNIDWLSPPLVYALIFWVFHFGLLFPSSISSNILDAIDPWTRVWIYQPDTVLALFAALLFLVNFALGVIVFYPNKQISMKSALADNAPELAKIGWVLIGISFLFILIAVTNVGWRIFFTIYQEFFPVHNSFSWAIIIMATGIMLQIASGKEIKTILKYVALLFLPVALPVMIAGSRTAPLFASAAIVSMLSIRGMRIPLKILVPAVLFLLVVTATVKDVRRQGLIAVLEQKTEIEAQNSLSGLTELGFSLRPVTASIDYIQSRGDFFYGETYAFPLIRQFQRLTGTRETSLMDERFISSTITRIYGAPGGGGLGYSVVAEAYVNGGLLGVALFGFIWGASIGWLSGRATTPYQLAILAVVLIPMFVNVRNSFVFVPAWITYGLLSIIAARFLAKSDRKRVFKR